MFFPNIHQAVCYILASFSLKISRIFFCYWFCCLYVRAKRFTLLFCSFQLWYVTLIRTMFSYVSNNTSPFFLILLRCLIVTCLSSWCAFSIQPLSPIPVAPSISFILHQSISCVCVLLVHICFVAVFVRVTAVPSLPGCKHLRCLHHVPFLPCFFPRASLRLSPFSFPFSFPFHILHCPDSISNPYHFSFGFKLCVTFSHPDFSPWSRTNFWASNTLLASFFL